MKGRRSRLDDEKPTTRKGARIGNGARHDSIGIARNVNGGYRGREGEKERLCFFRIVSLFMKIYNYRSFICKMQKRRTLSDGI